MCVCVRLVLSHFYIFLCKFETICHASLQATGPKEAAGSRGAGP